jgi:hypothetical protein
MYSSINHFGGKYKKNNLKVPRNAIDTQPQ